MGKEHLSYKCQPTRPSPCGLVTAAGRQKGGECASNGVSPFLLKADAYHLVMA